jgi:AbrB family looped-hinge helix DNA binding protein
MKAMQKSTKITSKGQITVPIEMRRLLGVRCGDTLIFESDVAGVHVRPARRRSNFSKYRGIGTPGISAGREGIAKWLRELRGEIE